MGSPSRNVQYHPPRLSEDRLNLPQPHSPSLPTHCTAPGNRECAPLRRAPAAQLDRVRELLGGMIEVDQPQHLCRREPERGDEALEASPDPGRAVGDEEHLVSGVEADLPRVRQQQGEDRLRSPERAVDDRGPRLRRSPVVADDVQDEELRFLPVGMESVAPLLRLGATLLAPHTDAAPVEGDDHPLAGHAGQQTARRALLGRSGPRSVAIGGRAEGLDIQGDALGAELRLRVGQRAEHGDRAACIGGQLRRAPVVDAQHHQGGVESRPPLRPTGVFLAVVRRRDRHRRAPGGANVDGLQAVAPHPPGQVAHEGARRVANRGGAHRALQHGGEEGAEELVRDGPQLLFALLRFLCRPGRWSTRLKLQRPPEGSAQVDGNVAKIDLAARGVDGALVHFNAPSWAVRAVMSSTILPVCPKTGSTSPSLTVHLCLHTAPGNRECAHVCRLARARRARAAGWRQLRSKRPPRTSRDRRGRRCQRSPERASFWTGRRPQHVGGV